MVLYIIRDYNNIIASSIDIQSGEHYNIIYFVSASNVPRVYSVVLK